MQTNFSDVEQRVKRYWFSDGIAELSGGVMFLLLGIYFALQQFLGQDSTVGGLLQASLVLMMIGGAYISRRMVNSLKTRITYPRTGYVEYQTDPKAARSRPILVMLLAFAVCFDFAHDLFTILVRPQSIGYVRIKSADPLAHPAFHVATPLGVEGAVDEARWAPRDPGRAPRHPTHSHRTVPDDPAGPTVSHPSGRVRSAGELIDMRADFDAVNTVLAATMQAKLSGCSATSRAGTPTCTDAS